MEPTPNTRRSSGKPSCSKSTKSARPHRKIFRLESNVGKFEEGEEERAKEEDGEATIPISVTRTGCYNFTKQYELNLLPQCSYASIAVETAFVMPRKDPTPEWQATVADEEGGDLDDFEKEYKTYPHRTKRQDSDKDSSPGQASSTPNRAPPVVEEERSCLKPRAPKSVATASNRRSQGAS